MNTTQSDGSLARRSRRAAPSASASDRTTIEHVPTSRELAVLESAHEHLLRQVHDLKRVYAAERERRARVARSTMDLATALARGGASSSLGPLAPADSKAFRGA